MKETPSQNIDSSESPEPKEKTKETSWHSKAKEELAKQFADKITASKKANEELADDLVDRINSLRNKDELSEEEQKELLDDINKLEAIHEPNAEINNNEDLFQELGFKLWEESTKDTERIKIKYLAGFDTEGAWKIRDKFYEEGKQRSPEEMESVYKPLLSESLVGLDSERAWKIRQDLKESGYTSIRNDRSHLDGIIGLDSEEAWKIRSVVLKGLIGTQIESALLESMVGSDREEAWKHRERRKEFGNIDSIAKSLIGMDSDKAWKMREDLLKVEDKNVKEPVRMRIILKNLALLDSEKAWEWRDKLIKQLEKEKNKISDVNATNKNNLNEIIEQNLIEGITGLDSERAWAIREANINSQTNPKLQTTLMSLAGLKSERAWKMRELLIEKLKDSPLKYTHPGVSSINGAPLIIGARKMMADKLRKKHAG